MPRSSFTFRAALLAAGALVVSLAAAPAASAAEAPAPNTAPEGPAVEWSVVPADASGPDGRISLRHELEPGASTGDAIAVTNLSAEAADFTVAAGDGRVGADGAFDVGTETPERGGAWVSVEGADGDGALTLAAGETRVLPVTIAVPADATPGDHPAGIVVGRSASDGGVTLTHRVGVRLHLQVAGEIEPALRIEAASASYAASWNPFSPGTLTVEYTVTNTGNVRLGASGSVDAAGPLGMLRTGTERGEARELLPGDTATQRVEVGLLPLVLLAGEVVVTPVALGDDRLALPEAASSGFSTLAMPWSLLVLVVLAVAALVAAVIAVRASRRRSQHRIEAAIAADRAQR
ncbi:COG1470 family protein [Microbacterium radiodurans]|uniref:DUF916 domain-containing protein n=1 Tax=Microbacterium radiodurans TaxID=661398 RepID=A0A5J5IRF2_9MICO|nr:DUF916 domain-containing protein [Microbacterium radiodurans]KAA9084954.1 DUF916 domain-containing protein [Microbacterium radiodurans]